MAQTYYHWGLHAWGIYALVGGAVAYAAYRRGRVPLMSAIFEKLFGKKHSEGFAGQLIDMFAIIAGLSACFVISAVSGISRGIRYLSSVNIVLTIGVISLFFFAGPTLFLLNMLPSASWGHDTVDFQSARTVYYWAWWISWSPFVGIFIARVSRGRTIRQFILGVILVPSSLLFLAYGVMGGVSMWLSREGQGDVSPDLSAPEVLFAVVDALPFALVLILIMVAWWRELATDPHAMREKCAATALSNAVLDGVQRCGDDFAIEVVPAHPGEGAGAEVDSEHDDYTEWYRRTDEDGAPVGYDFATGEWSDGWAPETGEIGTVVSEHGGATEQQDPRASAVPADQTTNR